MNIKELMKWMILLILMIYLLNELLKKFLKRNYLKFYFDRFLFLTPNEIYCLIQLKYFNEKRKFKYNDEEEISLIMNDRDFSYFILNKVSRSFSIVIEQLSNPLKDVICIFYLILRGLDTIEDDTIISREKKIDLLRNFKEKLNFPNDWQIDSIGENEDYRLLLKYFDKILRIFNEFDENCQMKIIDIVERMSNGMADFIEKKNEINNLNDYNLYCYYVAGLVGEGLTSLFSYFHFQIFQSNEIQKLSIDCGLFLQKTNIIRDYYEDLQMNRIWWPKQIWNKYVENISQFNEKPNERINLICLNEMIEDCLKHYSSVLKYLSFIENHQIFRFCSIPQVMALATLSYLINNSFIFTSTIKIPKRLTWKILLNCSTMNDVSFWTKLFLKRIEKNLFSSKSTIPIDSKFHQLIHQILLQSQHSLKT